MSEQLEREKLRLEVQHKKRRSVIRMVIAALMIAVIAFGFAFLLLHEIPGENRDVLNTLLGALTGSLLTIVAFYFGDSEGNEHER